MVRGGGSVPRDALPRRRAGSRYHRALALPKVGAADQASVATLSDVVLDSAPAASLSLVGSPP
jgi:hypothetical protein